MLTGSPVNSQRFLNPIRAFPFRFGLATLREHEGVDTQKFCESLVIFKFPQLAKRNRHTDPHLDRGTALLAKFTQNKSGAQTRMNQPGNMKKCTVSSGEIHRQYGCLGATHQ